MRTCFYLGGIFKGFERAQDNRANDDANKGGVGRTTDFTGESPPQVSLGARGGRDPGRGRVGAEARGRGAGPESTGVIGVETPLPHPDFPPQAQEGGGANRRS